MSYTLSMIYVNIGFSIQNAQTQKKQREENKKTKRWIEEVEICFHKFGLRHFILWIKTEKS